MIQKIFSFLLILSVSIPFGIAVETTNSQTQTINKLYQDKSIDSTNSIIDELSKEHPLEMHVEIINVLSERADKKTKNNILKAISNVVKNTKDNILIYTSLLAMARIGDYKNQDVVDAIITCFQKKISDVYIIDLLNILKSKVSSNTRKKIDSL